jgi:hypothetical protein
MNMQAEDLFRLAALAPADLRALAETVSGTSMPDPQVSATPLSYDWGSPVTAGLWQVEVTSQDRPGCTFFVKLVRHPRLWPGLRSLPDDAARAEFIGFYPWQYELDIHQSGIGSILPDGMRTAQLHHVSRPDADHMSLWWEFVHERTGTWTLADYRLAATLLGRLAARRRAGAQVNCALPAVARSAHNGESALRFYTSRRVFGACCQSCNLGRLGSIRSCRKRFSSSATGNCPPTWSRSEPALDHPGNLGGHETWKDAGSWQHSRNTRMSCANAQ